MKNFRPSRVVAALTAMMLCFVAGYDRAQARVPVPQKQVVDRIVVRIDGDIILWSEVRELGQFQILAGGRAAPENERVKLLIEQWIVRTEMDAASFPMPASAEVTGGVERLEKSFDTRAAFDAKLQELGLTRKAVARQLALQFRMARYLDYKFRPAVQVDSAQVGRYYREQFVPEVQCRGQQAPPLDSVQEQIRELLTQNEITARAGRWLEETRARLRVEIVPARSQP